MLPRLPASADAAIRLLLIDAQAHRRMETAGGLRAKLAQRLMLAQVSGGREAIEILRAESFDFVLLDLESLVDGGVVVEETIARLAKLSRDALTLVLTEDSSVSAALAVMRAGAHDCMARPLSADELDNRLRQLAARHGRGALFGADTPLRQTLADIAELAHASSQAVGISAVIGGAGERQLQQLASRLAALFDGSILPAPAPALQGPVLPMWRQEQRIIEEAIASFAGNVGLAAQALELSPSTIYRKRQAWAEMESRKGAA